MSESYLDTRRNVIISSPAGSGKTEKLARRYISLLESGADVEKILAITFTERAAAEMKDRILSILRRDNPELLAGLSQKIPLMRISTIHAFCLRLLRRFSVDLGFDPSLGVMDELQARQTWLESLYESIREEQKSPGDFFAAISQRGLRGWGAVTRSLDEIHFRRPYPEQLIAQGTEFDGEAGRIFGLYRRCLERYSAKKVKKHSVDFVDLELMAYEALSRGPEWHNILYAFDEHTDHILVDEFQDTSSLQWKIIDKLTEEWRSGMGAKHDQGKTPTVFLVGDEKQSIYQFRGANVSVFSEAKENFSRWLGENFHYMEATENYRSLPAVTEFVNRLFEKLMPGGLFGWKTGYSPFESKRQGEGEVELVLLNSAMDTKSTRANEARVLAKKIRALHGRQEVYGEDVTPRPCRYGDMAILLRKRTHLGIFEDALAQEGVPFVVLKGIGFYDSPEVAALRELLCFIVDPADDYTLFGVLRSPLFGFDYPALARLMKGKDGALGKLLGSTQKSAKDASNILNELLESARRNPMSVVLEEGLVRTGAWARYWEEQRHVNIKKFIGMVESFEADGLSPVEIREKLLRHRFDTDVPKANVNAEGMDAVRILTVHAAKGLEFPMVFVPSLEESLTSPSGPVLLDDENSSVVFAYEEDSALRRKDETFRLKKLKMEEEEKRLFYVALTRARDYLCLVGSHADDSKAKGRLEYLSEAFDIFNIGGEPLPFRILTEHDIAESSEAPGLTLAKPDALIGAPAYTEELEYSPDPEWSNVAGDTELRKRHGEDWALAGRVMHSVFEELSKGILYEKDITERAELLLQREGAHGSDLIKAMLGDVRNLKQVGLMDDIIMPSKESYAELPFVMKRGKKVFSGRIDRVICKPDRVNVYDYKTFPVTEEELPELIEAYRFQLEVYREAAEKLFGKQAKAYILFTHLPRLEAL